LILVLDNYDSFTFNLVQYLGELGRDISVRRNDGITLREIEEMSPEAIVISPGPRTPAEAGISPAAIRTFAGRVPILGVCLGHQAIGQVFGGRVVPAGSLMHGKTSKIWHDGRGIYAGLENPFTATRYHSLAVSRESLPGCLEVSARASDGEIMGLRHREHLVEGVQFHPESILTGPGKEILRNFIGLAEREQETERKRKGGRKREAERGNR
jgi:anthranilate synthase/aminodeoxychorismate synthase-like glutamine amidotransferase